MLSVHWTKVCNKQLLGERVNNILTNRIKNIINSIWNYSYKNEISWAIMFYPSYKCDVGILIVILYIKLILIAICVNGKG